MTPCVDLYRSRTWRREQVFAGNTSNHITVLLREMAHSLITRVMAAKNKILIAIALVIRLLVVNVGTVHEILYTEGGR